MKSGNKFLETKITRDYKSRYKDFLKGKMLENF